MKDTLVTIGQFIIEVVIVVIITVIIKEILQLDAYQEIVLGIILLTAIWSIGAHINNNRAVALITKVYEQRRVWKETNESVRTIQAKQMFSEGIDTKLKELSKGLLTISERHSTENRLFEHWYQDKLYGLCEQVAHTLETNTAIFDTSLVLEADRIFDVFQGRPTDWFMATSNCAGAGMDFWLTTNGDVFIQNMDAKHRSGKVLSIKRVFSYNSESELKQFKTQLAFYLHQQSGYEFKIIDVKEFESVLHFFEDNSLVADFGVYGTHFVWETPPESKIYLSHGKVCADKLKIEKYTKLFNRLWDQSDYYNLDVQAFKQYKGLRMDAFRRLATGGPT